MNLSPIIEAFEARKRQERLEKEEAERREELRLELNAEALSVHFWNVIIPVLAEAEMEIRAAGYVCEARSGSNVTKNAKRLVSFAILDVTIGDERGIGRNFNLTYWGKPTSACFSVDGPPQVSLLTKGECTAESVKARVEEFVEAIFSPSPP